MRAARAGSADRAQARSGRAFAALPQTACAECAIAHSREADAYGQSAAAARLTPTPRPCDRGPAPPQLTAERATGGASGGTCSCARGERCARARPAGLRRTQCSDDGACQPTPSAAGFIRHREFSSSCAVRGVRRGARRRAHGQLDTQREHAFGRAGRAG